VSAAAGRVAIVFPGDPANWHASAPSPRLAPVFTALARMGLAAAPVPYAAARADEMRGRLLAADAILAWVDPVSEDGDRTALDGNPVPGPDAIVLAQHAHIRDGTREEVPLGQLMDRCAAAFAAHGGTGTLIDQAFARRIGHGIIRAYLVSDQVTGFARQYPKGLSPEDRAARGISLDAEVPADGIMGLPSSKTMYPPGEPAFARLRRLLEDEWVPGMQAILGLGAGSLPVLWDADFLFGPHTADGQDSYLLCEINASSVTPFPPEAVPLLARATARAVMAARTASKPAGAGLAGGLPPWAGRCDASTA